MTSVTFITKPCYPFEQKIIASVFKGKLIFQKNGYQTNGYNEVSERIPLLDKDSNRPKKEQASNNGSLFEKVTRTGLKPVTYCLEGSCSIQLSYRAKKNGSKDNRKGY